MRKLILGLALGVLFGAVSSLSFAADMDPRLIQLRREIKVKLEERGSDVKHSSRAFELSLYYSTMKDGRVYYQVQVEQPTRVDWPSAHNETDVVARVMARGEVLWLTVVRAGERVLLHAPIPEGAVYGTDLRGAKVSTIDGNPKELRLTSSGQPYWYKYKSRGAAEDRAVSLELLSDLFTDDQDRQALGTVRVTGKMDYRACDGCEHGDQFMLEDEYAYLSGQHDVTLNVVDVDWGSYYTAGCDDGTLHAWLTQLMELGVKFTYVGRITSLSPDLWEGDYWTAEKSGKLYVDNDAKVELKDFLDKLPAKDGVFKSYDAETGIVVFEHAGGKIRIDMNHPGQPLE